MAVSRYAMYPEGHPARATSSATLAQRVSAQATGRGRGSVSIGVARRQLVVEGVPTNAEHPLLRALAERLHRQHIGALMIGAEVTPAELDAALRLLGDEAEPGSVPLGLGDPARLRISDRVRLFRVSYDSLELVGEEAGATRAPDARASELWLGLARAALARGEDEEVTEIDAPEVVARAINEHPAAAAYDQVIVGYLTQLASELRTSDAGAAAEVRDRLSRMMGELDTATLTRLIEMDGDGVQRQRFVLDATDSFATRAVVEVLQAAAAASGQTISHAMLRLLRKLADHAEATGVRGEADSALRAQVRELIEGWSLADPNPEEYTRALERIAEFTPGAPGATSAHPAEPMRVVQMALEVGAVGSALWNAVGALLGAGRLSELIDTLRASGSSSPVAGVIWRHLEISDVVRDVIATEPVDFASLDHLLENIPSAATTTLLLDRLSESTDRDTRMGLFQRLVRGGPQVVPALTERLRDARWYVLRNMLALMAELRTCPAEVAPLEFARHEHGAVRREALLLALNTGRERERAVAMALTDPDESIVRLGVQAAREYGFPRAAVALALKAFDNAALPSELRLEVLGLLDGLHEPLLLEALLRRVAPTRGLLGRPRLAARSPEMLAALAMVARGWPQDSRVRAVLARAHASGDAAIVAAAGRT